MLLFAISKLSRVNYMYSVSQWFQETLQFFQSRKPCSVDFHSISKSGEILGVKNIPEGERFWGKEHLAKQRLRNPSLTKGTQEKFSKSVEKLQPDFGDRRIGAIFIVWWGRPAHNSLWVVHEHADRIQKLYPEDVNTLIIIIPSFLFVTSQFTQNTPRFQYSNFPWTSEYCWRPF